ncbi:MOSC domain-containing protein [Catelliglobosispora koreensis]|uniref:MOSC domain-containing protein n=1 Tax=Catelliglobosispora koreensis TaxID=129052 RepID=UPI00036FA5C6
MSRILSVNLPQPGAGFSKHPVDHLVTVPVGDDVYAYARDDYDWWQARLSRRLPNGLFGETITTEDLDLGNAVIGETWRIGPRLMVQLVPGRILDIAFQHMMGEPRWMKTFARSNRPGAWLRVLEPGEVWAGDPVSIEDRPANGITIAQAQHQRTMAP